MSSGGSSSSGKQTTTIRYAPYVESHHSAFLDLISTKRNLVVDDSPFSGWSAIPLDDAFFGVGYIVSSFPSLYDMYGKFMAGLDIEVLYGQIFEDAVNGPEISNLVSAEAALMEDDMDTSVLPRFKAGMRDINSVVSSSFVIGKAIIEDARVKALSKFSTGLKYQMIPVASDRWKAHLDWNKGVIMTYAEMMKLYYSAKMDITDFNYAMVTKDKLWPFTVLEYERAALGALQGATNAKTDIAGASTASKAIAGALTGAATGAMIGSAIPGVGTAVGAAIGGIMGLAGGLF